ncbi:MAG TPA: hypothetical protein VMV44_03585 [Rectinemataceae bacterium]|nr:hypothetical protein [Rectinemataceae bacterium]
MSKTFGESLDRLAELGMDIVHLRPFMKSPEGENDGGEEGRGIISQLLLIF